MIATNFWNELVPATCHNDPKPKVHIQAASAAAVRFARSRSSICSSASDRVAPGGRSGEKQNTGPEHQRYQSDSHWGRGWWGWRCVAALQLKPANSKMWNVMEMGTYAFTESRTWASRPMSPIWFLSRSRNLRVVFSFSISANVCRKRQSDHQNAKEFSAQKRVLKNKRALAPASPIWLLKRTILVMDVLIFKASATASPHRFRPRTMALPNAGLKQNALGLGFGVADETEAGKDELGGSAVLLQLIGEVLFGHHGARGAEEAKRSVVGDFFYMSFVWRSYNRKPSPQEHWNRLWMSTKTAISWTIYFISSQAKHHKSQCEISKYVNLGCCHWHTCAIAHPILKQNSLSWIRTFPGKTSARSGCFCWSVALVASKKHTQVGLRYLCTSPCHSIIWKHDPNSSCNIFILYYTINIPIPLDCCHCGNETGTEQMVSRVNRDASWCAMHPFYYSLLGGD